MNKTRLRLGRHNLPEELLAEILSRLPVKSLLRFRSVSKLWRSLIADPDFPRSHLLRFHNNLHETHLLIAGWRQGFDVRSTQSLKLAIASRNLLAGVPAGNWNVISSVDGLFLLRSFYPTRTTMLWNPATRETLIPPPCPDISKDKEISVQSVDLGLGFDPLVKDYKYVKLVYTKLPTQILHSVAVYSLATNSWKVTARFEQPLLERSSSTLCLRGVLFFLATSTLPGEPVQLVSFDLRSETFTYSTKLPIEEDRERGDLPVRYGPLSDSPMAEEDDTECSLAVVYLWPAKGSGAVWTLEGLGADDDHIKSRRTWSKRYTFASMIPEFDGMAGTCNLFYLRKNGEMLLEWKSMITSYNLKSHKEKVLLRKSLGSSTKAWPYMESLVMLNK